MLNLRRFAMLVSAMGLLGATVHAQNIISAKSGMVHYVEGEVFLDGTPVEIKYNLFPEIKEGQVFRTSAEGRAEILLNPGTFLRLAESSSFKMIDKRLIDTRIEMLNGVAIVEVAELGKDNNLTVAFKDATVELHKAGMYRLDAEAAELRVYKGEAIVVRGGETLTVKESHMTQLAGVTGSPQKFDSRLGDSFYRWAARRAASISVANLSAAKTLRDSGYSSGMGSSWRWNPYFGMFTFIPGNGMYYSPFGYYFYSPRAVERVYQSYYNNYGGSGGFAPSYNASTIDRSVGYNPSYGYTTAPRSSDVFSPAPSAGNGAAVSPGAAGRGGSGGDAGAGRGGTNSGRGR